MLANFPCKLCKKRVAKNDHAVPCDSCHLWVHIKCNEINLQRYKSLQESSFACYCIQCFKDINPFSTISNKNIYEGNLGKKEKLKVLTKKVLPCNDDLVDNGVDDPESNMICSKY